MQWTGNSGAGYGSGPYGDDHGYGPEYAQHPGYGYGPAQGYGYGQSPGYGSESGYGYGQAYGGGYGPGQAYGGGYGSGHGQAPGYGYGYGYGQAHGGGNGTAAVPAPQACFQPWPQPTGAVHPDGADRAPRPGTAAAAPAAPPDRPGPDAKAHPGPPPDRAEPGRPQTPDAGPGLGEAVRPVFVDSSGRRPHRVRRAARLMVIPAGGYVALLVSTVLGGPSVNAPAVPQSGDAAQSVLPVSDAHQPTGNTGPTAGQQGSRLAAALPGSAAAPVAYRTGQAQSTSSRP